MDKTSLHIGKDNEFEIELLSSSGIPIAVSAKNSIALGNIGNSKKIVGTRVRLYETPVSVFFDFIYYWDDTLYRFVKNSDDNISVPIFEFVGPTATNNYLLDMTKSALTLTLDNKKLLVRLSKSDTQNAKYGRIFSDISFSYDSNKETSRVERMIYTGSIGYFVK